MSRVGILTVFVIFLLMGAAVALENLPSKGIPEDINSKGEPASEEFSGHYVFDGKVYFYDQESGEFNPLTDGKTKEPQTQQPTLKDYIDDESESFESEQKRPVSLAALARGAQGFDNELISCTQWGNPIIKEKTFPSKDECNDELSREKDKAIMKIDASIEDFESKKRALLLNMELDAYKKLSAYKLSSDATMKIINEVFSKGCDCMD